MAARHLLVFISDLHLTDALKGPQVSRVEQLERFWKRIEAARNGMGAEIVFVGDLFDIVRSPRWLECSSRPYKAPSPASITIVEQIVDATLEREKPFFDMLRAQVQRQALSLSYILGNHDRLLQRDAPA